jgi:hypothetical protein
VDRAAVESAVERVVAEHPHWRRPSGGFDSGARREPATKDAPSFGVALEGGSGTWDPSSRMVRVVRRGAVELDRRTTSAPRPPSGVASF